MSAETADLMVKLFYEKWCICDYYHKQTNVISTYDFKHNS